MSSDIAIKVENLSKCYQIYGQPRDRLKQFILPHLQHMVGQQPEKYYKEFWALKNINFEVKKGETVGIIGRNGSGKSTLLQVICGTLNPTTGNVATHGRIAALLELGSGFNPEFSGRENIYMSCALLGLNNDEINDRFEDILAFADIGQFIEQPIKTYSSGMFVRLAFAVNVISSPDIMVVDEALAVGDMNFQAKCMTALTRFQDNGGTVLFVSHDVGSVKSLCKQAVYLERGEILSVGHAPEVAERYIRAMREEMNKEARTYSVVSKISNLNDEKPLASDFEKNKDNESLFTDSINNTRNYFKRSEEFDQRVSNFRYGSGDATIRFVELLDFYDEPIVAADFNQLIRIKIYFDVQKETELSVNYYIHDDKKNPIVGAGLRTIGHPLLNLKQGAHCVTTYETNLPLQEGSYSIQVELTRPAIIDQTADFLDVIDNAVIFNVKRKENGRIWAKVFIENQVNIYHIEN